MDKIAQKRSLLNKLRSVTDFGGIAAEKYFNPEFKEIMEQLYHVDDEVRANVLGEQSGEAVAPSDAISLKDILKSAKSNINRREYMKAVSDLGRFHTKVFDIVKLLNTLKNNVDRIHEKFLFQDLDEESKKHLQSFRGRWASTSLNTYLIKEANILDFFTNIATERGRALAAWEKRYPNKVKKLKNDTIVLLSLSEKLLNIILNSLKDMDKARSTRNPDNYITISDKIIASFKDYDSNQVRGFRKFYEDNVKEFLEKQEFFAPTKIDTTDKPSDLGQQNINIQSPVKSPIEDDNSDLTATLPNPPPVQQTLVPEKRRFEKIDPKTTEIVSYEALVNPSTGEIISPNVTNPILPKIPSLPPVPEVKKNSSLSHKNFFKSLNYLSDEKPIVLAAHIKRYAKSIWKNDPETSIKLFNIVKSIEG